MRQIWFILAACLILAAGVMMIPSTPPLDAATQADCLKGCLDSYNICTKKCEKKKKLKDQSDCDNKCQGRWFCCQDICYGIRKTCP